MPCVRLKRFDIKVYIAAHNTAARHGDCVDLTHTATGSLVLACQVWYSECREMMYVTTDQDNQRTPSWSMHDLHDVRPYSFGSTIHTGGYIVPPSDACIG